MEKFEISDIDVFNYVNEYLASQWSKYTGIHNIVSFDDFVQDIMLLLYEKGRDGIIRLEKYKSKGEAYFYNVINYIIRVDLVAYTKPKYQENRDLHLEDKLKDCDNLTVLDTLSNEEDSNSEEEMSLKFLLEEISNKQISHYIFKEVDGNSYKLTQRFLCKKILAGYKISELVPYVYNELTGKPVISQTMYNLLSELRKDIVELYKREKIMEVNYLNEHVGRKYSCEGSTC